MTSIPYVAAVHDISGFGRVSLTVALPVLTAMGCHCSPLPTAYLSTHTGFPDSEHSVFLDMTSHMIPTLQHWQELGASFDAIYSGFLGSEKQIDILSGMIDHFLKPGGIALIDPVMGDHGKLYRTYNSEMCQQMSKLTGKAHLITPNLTEAAILLQEPYDEFPSKEKMDDWLLRLSLNGKRSVIITGICPEPGMIGACCFDREDKTIHAHTAIQRNASLNGTGDLFASIVLGRLLQHKTLSEATRDAVTFTSDVVDATIKAGHQPVEGPDFEPFLSKLAK